MDSDYQVMTEQEISEDFDKAMDFCLQLEEGNPVSDESVIAAITKLQDIQKNIIRLHLFSPNEDFEEIKGEHLKYLLLPFFVGECFGRVSDPVNRKTNLIWCETYLTEFYKLAAHYELVPKNMKTQFKMLKDLGRKFRAEREDKIANFKEIQQFNLKLKNLEKLEDEKSIREVIGLKVMKSLYKVIEMIPLNYQELDILDFKDKMQQNSDLANQYKEDATKPVPKMKVWNIPGLTENPYLIGNPVVQGNGSSCHGCGANTEAEQRLDHITKVWQPGANMPTMTLDEFADMEIANMQKQEAMQKKAMEEAKRQEEEQDPEKDEWHDQQTLKDRHWDDWKDDNEKGAGNKNGR